jgi:quercetin dioxygenase-like cupin family protein
MMRILLSLAMLAAVTGLAGAQDGGTSASGVYKQVLDNERVRVFQADFKPGDKLGLRNYPNHLMVMLTDGTLVFIPAGRTGYEVNFKAGETMWFPPLARATENDSDREVRVLVVEFKEGAASRSAAPAKGKSKAKAKPQAKGKAAKPKARPKKKA